MVLLNLFIGFLILPRGRLKTIPGAVFLACAILLAAGALKGASYLQRSSLHRQFPRGELVDYQTSVYGTIALIKEQEQSTFYYNGQPSITIPYPDIEFSEFFAHLPLLFHADPRDILLAGAGAGGLINEILKYPVRSITYVTLDPLEIAMLKRYPTPLTYRELTDTRVETAATDPRVFLRMTLDSFDVILLGVPLEPQLSTQRFFTREFFEIVKKRLHPQGIFALYLPGSLTYYGREMKDSTVSIVGALKNVFPAVRCIPGDQAIILASLSRAALALPPAIIEQRLRDRGIVTRQLNAPYLEARLNPALTLWFDRSMQNTSAAMNLDLKPFALFSIISLWSKQFSPTSGGIFSFLRVMSESRILFIILLFAVMVWFVSLRKGKTEKIPLIYSIATTGFAGMLINCLLIFVFQIKYGCLYSAIGVLISTFMAGSAVGSFLMIPLVQKIRDMRGFFILIEVIFCLFIAAMAVYIVKLALQGPAQELFITGSLCFTGFIMGVEFIAAGALFSKGVAAAGKTAGTLYAADLCGGWLAGLLAGIFFLPLLGFWQTCLIIGIMKISSVIILSLTFVDSTL